MHLGIDFGTCFTSAAILTGSSFRSVPDTSGGHSLPYYPSVACLASTGEMQLGMLAKSMARKDPTRFRQEFKRDLGSNTPYLMGDQSFLPQDLIAKLLARLKTEAEAMVNSVLPAAVLTVPASYDAYRRDLMVEAAVAAGFREDGVVLLNEPEAAALYYDWQLKQQNKTVPENAIVLVYDLGGGTFDAALVRKSAGQFRSIAPPVGDPLCGGIDFDRTIYQEIEAVAGQDLRDLLSLDNTSLAALRTRQQIADYCREVKHRLTVLPQYEDVLPSAEAEDFLLNRETFQQKIAPFIDRTLQLCRELVTNVQIEWNVVSGILLIGGSTRIPYVSTRLTEAFGRPIWRVDEPELAVCYGAAIRPGYRRTLKSAVLESVSRADPMLVSGNKDRTLHLWDTSTGEIARTFTGHSGYVWSLAFSPDGKSIASGSADRSVKLWNTDTGELIRTFTGHSACIWSLAFSPDGKSIVSGSEDDTIKLWNTDRGELIRTFTGHSSNLRSVTFSPDGKSIASGSLDHTIKLWNVATGELLRTLTGHSSNVYSVAFSPDGKSIVSGSEDNTIKLWNTDTGELIRTFTGHLKYVWSLAFSPDGKSIASGSADQSVKLWNVATGELLRTLTGHSVFVRSVIFSPDGKSIASGSEDNTIKLWNTDTGELIRTLVGIHGFLSVAFVPQQSGSVFLKRGHVSRVRSIAAHTSGNLLATGSDDRTIKLWETKTGTVTDTVEGKCGKIAALAFAEQGNMLVTADDALGCWPEITEGSQLNRLEPAFGPMQGINGVAGSADGKLIGTAGDDSLVCLWETTSRELVHVYYGHRARVYCVVFSPDNALLFSGSDDCTLKVWNVPERQLLTTLTGHEAGVLSVAISHDGKTLASAGRDKTVRLWDVTTWKPIHVLTQHTEPVHSVAFSKDGSSLASAGADKTIRLWNVATGDLLDTLNEHEDAINAVLFAANDTRLVSAGDDRSVRFWNLEWA